MKIYKTSQEHQNPEDIEKQFMAEVSKHLNNPSFISKYIKDKERNKPRFPKPYTPKPSKYTKQDIINGRLSGLKYLDRACQIVPKADIIKQSIETARNPLYETPSAKSNSWGHFSWAFGNTFRHIISPQADLSTTFNLDEALTKEEMNYVAKELNITENYIPVRQRSL